MNAIKTMCTFSTNVIFNTAIHMCERTNRYKTRDVVKTYLNVTFEDLFSNAPTLAKIEFGNSDIQLFFFSSVMSVHLLKATYDMILNPRNMQGYKLSTLMTILGFLLRFVENE